MSSCMCIAVFRNLCQRSSIVLSSKKEDLTFIVRSSLDLQRLVENSFQVGPKVETWSLTYIHTILSVRAKDTDNLQLHYGPYMA